MTETDDLRRQKQQIRRLAFADRQAQESKDEHSRQIMARLTALPAYENSTTVMFYVDVRSEVRTRLAIEAALNSGKQVVVPYCVGDDLELFRLKAMADLEIGTFGILEPLDRLRKLPDRKADVRDLDLILVPGVAFDRHGGRLGHGKGYYDKLLRNARADTPLVALAFECQLFPKIPTEKHDVFMDMVIAENGIYDAAVSYNP